MKYCVNCKHHKIDMMLHMCINPKIVVLSEVTGKLVDTLCETLRDNACIAGKYFEDETSVIIEPGNDGEINRKVLHGR